MAFATVEAIRDRLYTLIEGLTPLALSADRFRRYRNEGKADFETWANAGPAGALRRFQVRADSHEGPDVSNTDFDARIVTFRITVAYPQTARTGPDQAMDRDDAMDSDFRLIDRALGFYGRANFSATHDCTPLGTTPPTPVSGAACDFLEATASFRYYLEAP